MNSLQLEVNILNKVLKLREWETESEMAITWKIWNFRKQWEFTAFCEDSRRIKELITILHLSVCFISSLNERKSYFNPGRSHFGPKKRMEKKRLWVLSESTHSKKWRHSTLTQSSKIPNVFLHRAKNVFHFDPLNFRSHVPSNRVILSFTNIISAYEWKIKPNIFSFT